MSAPVLRAAFALMTASAVMLGLAGVPAANGSWEAPAQVAPASLQVDGGGAAAATGINDANVVIAYLTDNTHVDAALRDKGAGAYTVAVPVASTSGPNTLLSPALAVTAQGQALAFWGLNTPDTANEAVQCATRAVAAATFGACSTNLLGPPGLFSNNWRVGRVRAAGNAGGSAAVTFEGPGGSNGWNFSRAFGGYGGLAGTPATVALTGNIGVFGSGTNNYPEVAVNAAGDAMAVWTGWPEQTQRTVEVGYRDHLGAGWYVRPSGGVIYCCSNYGPGDYRIALDGAGNGYLLMRGGDNGNPGTNGIVFAYASRDFALGGAGSWGTQQQLDLAASAKQPRIGVDAAGDATAIWVDADLATGNDALYAAYRPAGAGTTFGTAVQVEVAPGSGQIGNNELVVDPDGSVTIAWTTCEDAGCANRAVRATTRAPDGGAFRDTVTLASSNTVKSGLRLSGDPQREALATWSEGASNAIYASVYSYTPPPVPGGTTERPQISNLNIRPASFRAASRGRSIVTSMRTGATVSYFDSLAARAIFKVFRKKRGVKSNGRCVAPSRRLAGGKACTRWAAVRGDFTRTDTAGTNSFRFSGRLNRKTLVPGTYRLTATPLADDDTAGTADSARFKIKR